MTRDTSRPPQSDHIEGGVDADLLASLWEHAPFPRLPRDAPAELRDYVQAVENPRHVYTIHQAARRYTFQSLVEQFVHQLREGCDSSTCTTPTCFSCRKRLVGKAPIRRYNPTSARTLAVYLASQDNPEKSLCPNLRLPKEAAAAASSLIISPLYKSHSGPSSAPGAESRDKRPSDHRNDRKKPTSNSLPPKSESRRNSESKNSIAKDPVSRPPPEKSTFVFVERSASVDHRSFAANMFGTVAFKMLEWLTPNSFEYLSSKVSELQSSRSQPAKGVASTSPSSAPSKADPSRDSETVRHPDVSLPTKIIPEEQVNSQVTDQSQDQPQLLESHVIPHKPNAGTKPRRRRKSNARVRATSTSKPKRKMSAEPFPAISGLEEPIPGLVSPRTATHTEKALRPPKSGQHNPWTIPEVPSRPGFFGEVPEHFRAPTNDAGPKTKARPPAGTEESRPRKSDVRADPRREDEMPKASDGQSQPRDALSAKVLDVADDQLLPQSLSQLNLEIVTFLSDILKDDRTFENNLLHLEGGSTLEEPRRVIRRKALGLQPYPLAMKLEWKTFIEQSIFYVLSDPHALARSFTRDGQLLSSTDVWQSMVKMIEVAPSLVFHSLWIAAASLFRVPKSLQSLRSPTTRVFKNTERSLSNVEAGIIMSICAHALVAAVPEGLYRGSLYDISRRRSSGLVLGGNSMLPRVPNQTCLQSDDAFANDLMMRLAKRLCSAIIARRYFSEMADHDESITDSGEDLDVLRPILAQIESLNIGSTLNQRIPTLLLDWARAVLLNDWDGQAEFLWDSPFGGALSLIEAMYKKRRDLLVPDVNFKVEYFSDRLDSASVSVAWLGFSPTRQRRHLFDYPYIFNSSSLVSYFRSINFSRMSRSFEESSSLQERIKLIVKGTLIQSDHHKNVLQDMLKVSTTKYLVLTISRKNVIEDAFDQLWQRQERELLRPLKVHLGEEHGEEGFDSGGVQQEFFRLAIAECLDPAYGAFSVDERSRMAWFVPGSVVDTWKFQLIGLLFSLALYNGLTLPVTLPSALYRKLLGEPVTELHHIEDGWPELADGLTTLLEWDETNGLVDDVFARTYEFSVESFGQPISRDMSAGTTSEWPRAAGEMDETAPAAANPIDAPMVTNENRSVYVSDYIRYLTDVSVRPQFEAFERGFRACLHPKSLQLLSPPILQTLVEGIQEIDITELRRYTRYVGWDASHRSIKDFWSIVKRYDDDMKRKLLEFVTASDRVPVGGMGNLQFVLQRNGEEVGEHGRLPTAYTCYGTLLLPEYGDKEVLRERLAMALENAQGFGFA